MRLDINEFKLGFKLLLDLVKFDAELKFIYVESQNFLTFNKYDIIFSAYFSRQ